MKILTALTYYRPYVSGLTLYAARLAEALAGRGHAVTVLTSRHNAQLPQREELNGVRVARMDVRLRLGKGPLMPALPFLGWKLARQADVIHLHLPQFDAALLAFYGRLLHKPVVLTYHCDLSLPPGVLNRIAGAGSDFSSRLSARLAHKIVTNTADYAAHSPVLRRHLEKVTPILPPVDISCEKAARQDPDRGSSYRGFPGPFIGMVGRLASEKGAEILAAALPQVRERYPTVMVLHAGEHENIPGEGEYIRQSKAMVDALNANTATPAWRFLGRLSDDDLAELLDACELTALPSLNSTESFGMVQVESMARGAPVAASDLPGVREPVRMTGMGEIAPPGDPEALASAILRILDRPAAYRTQAIQAKRDEIIHAMRPDSVAAAYEAIFTAL